MEIVKELLRLQDLKFKVFLERLLPGIKEEIIGVKNQLIRKIAKELEKDEKQVNDFLNDLPHYYHEENKLHAYLISNIKYDKYTIVNKIDEFIPYITNWETCDILTPKLLLKDKSLIHDKCIEWIENDYMYSKRFGVVMAKKSLVNPLDTDVFKIILNIKSTEYYVNMAIAWYLAEICIYYPNLIIELIQGRK